MQIPVVIVDDEEVDRLIALKRLERSRSDICFAPLREYAAGDAFLSEYFISKNQDTPPGAQLLVLMDVNMPGRNGFETVEEMSRQISCGDAAKGIVVMMFTTSENLADFERAKACDLVKGFIVKPFDDEDIDTIIALYEAEAGVDATGNRVM